MSPCEDRHIVVKFFGKVSGSVTAVVKEYFQQWWLACLALGFVLLLLAPIVSHWVPFYYSSSMCVNSVLINYGLNAEMHNTVFKIVLVEIILAENVRDTWQSSVPPWEKKLCSLIGSVPWKRLVATKKCNIINSLPCDISLSDPNFYSEAVTSLECDRGGGFQLAVEGSTGKVLRYALHSSYPIRVKHHRYGGPILDINWHRTLNSAKPKLFTIDNNVVRIWDT
ncbi:hypothetical protein I3760_15G102600 [Carya illinoinensis]|nr:hypothetical protein I3760_15G102600 [Carya illinoinensis]